MKRKSTRAGKPQESSYNRLEPAFRQRQLIEATAQVIARYGISSVTLQRVAEAANVTAGMVNFHFKSKGALLTATLESLVDEYTETLSRVIDAADGPAAGLCAIAQQHFAPPLMTKDKVAVWYAFWGETHARLGYQQICARADRFLSDLVSGLVRQLQPPPPDPNITRALSAGFIGLINLLNQEMMTSVGDVDPNASIAICHQYLRFVFPDHRFELSAVATTDITTQPSLEQLGACTPISPDWIAAILRDISQDLAQGLSLPDICTKLRLDAKMINFLRQKYQGMSSDQIRYVIDLETRLRQLTEALAGQALSTTQALPDRDGGTGNRV